MRTIPATFDTKEEAETAIRRLEAIGVAPDRILLREVEETGGASEPDVNQMAGRSGASRAFFLTAKVGPEQIDAATEILKRSTAENKASPLPLDTGAPSSAPATSHQQPTATGNAAAPYGAAPGGETADIHRSGTGSKPPGPQQAVEASVPGSDEAVRDRAPQHQRHSAPSSTDWRRWAQYGIIYCLFMVAAFTGGWLLGSVF